MQKKTQKQNTIKNGFLFTDSKAIVFFFSCPSKASDWKSMATEETLRMADREEEEEEEDVGEEEERATGLSDGIFDP